MGYIAVMPSATDTVRFEDRAVDHLLDFTRDREISVELPRSFRDVGRMSVTIPTVEHGDKIGADALMHRMSRGEFRYVTVLHKGWRIPCCVSAVGPSDSDALTLDLIITDRVERDDA